MKIKRKSGTKIFALPLFSALIIHYKINRNFSIGSILNFNGIPTGFYHPVDLRFWNLFSICQVDFHHIGKRTSHKLIDPGWVCFFYQAFFHALFQDIPGFKIIGSGRLLAHFGVQMRIGNFIHINEIKRSLI